MLWLRDINLYNTGRDSARMGLYLGMSEYNENPRLRSTAQIPEYINLGLGAP